MYKKNIYSLSNKILPFINIIFATLLLLTYLSVYISPKKIAFTGLFSLITPILFIINSFFFIYWVLYLKKQFLISILPLLIGFFFSSPFYIISNKQIIKNDDLKVMSYNVRALNLFKWIKNDKIDKKIKFFINKKQPDILTFQEYYTENNINFLNYPFKYFISTSKQKKIGLAIFSKFKIINKGSLNFKNSSNNTIFIDLVKKKDTIRIYNIHLQSFKINPKKYSFGEKKYSKFYNRLIKGFKKQAAQVELIVNHEKKFKGKKILCGDFNNTAYSWVYKQLSKNKKDAFIEAGKGFGKTYNLIFPFRIDFILSDKKSQISNFETFNIKYSDHFPIMARINWK